MTIESVRAIDSTDAVAGELDFGAMIKITEDVER